MGKMGKRKWMVDGRWEDGLYPMANFRLKISNEGLKMGDGVEFRVCDLGFSRLILSEEGLGFVLFGGPNGPIRG
jgi:hypothetical protein